MNALRNENIGELLPPERLMLTPGPSSVDPRVYRAMAADCRARGVPLVWVLIPRVGRPSDPAGHSGLVTLVTCSPHFGFLAAAADSRHIPRPSDCTGGPPAGIAPIISLLLRQGEAHRSLVPVLNLLSP